MDEQKGCAVKGFAFGLIFSGPIWFAILSIGEVIWKWR